MPTENPATGSANGALGAYLVHHAATHPALRQAMGVTEPTTHILSEQGGEISAVRVGGQVVLMAEGFGARSLLNSLSTKLGEGKY